MSDEVIHDLRQIYGVRACKPYGLTAVHQLQHALQCAWQAEQAGASAELITAALLHDVGHMIHDLGEYPAAQGVNDNHEERGAIWLAMHLGPAVTEPVRLHVDAKRYLCAVQPGYAERLSPDSIESLTLQGGPMRAAEREGFEREAHWQDAVQLRTWDEAAKDPQATPPDWTHFETYLRQALAATPSMAA